MHVKILKYSVMSLDPRPIISNNMHHIYAGFTRRKRQAHMQLSTEMDSPFSQSHQSEKESADQPTPSKRAKSGQLNPSPIFNDLRVKYCLNQTSLDSQVTTDHLLDVSMLLSYWKPFARAAGLTHPEIVAIDRDNHTEHDRRYEALYLWHQKNAYHATYSELVRIMLTIKKADIAQKVCRLLSKNESKTSISGKQEVSVPYCMHGKMVNLEIYYYR